MMENRGEEIEVGRRLERYVDKDERWSNEYVAV